MSAPRFSGTLHIFVAFDWGEEILLDQVGKLVPASSLELARRRRTPSSISYRPAPLHLKLEPVPIEPVHCGKTCATAGLTLFDFGAVSVSMRLALNLTTRELRDLAGTLADPGQHVQAARSLLAPINQLLLPAIKEPIWHSDFSEEFFVFQFTPSELPLAEDAELLAALLHLESEAMSAEEVQEATRLRLSYSPRDLFLADWAAAVLFDADCEESLQVIEFANLQLLEFRHIDNRLDDALSNASRTLQPLTRSYLPFWKGYSRPLRRIGQLRMEANDLFERTGNALKLVGEPYLARVYRLIASRFHLESWEADIRRKLDVLEGVYQIVADQASHFRAEFLELIVVLLILIEIVMAIWGH